MIQNSQAWSNSFGWVYCDWAPIELSSEVKVIVQTAGRTVLCSEGRLLPEWVATTLSWLLMWWNHLFLLVRRSKHWTPLVAFITVTGVLHGVCTSPTGFLGSLLLQFLISVPKLEWCGVTSTHFTDIWITESTPLSQINYSIKEKNRGNL